jgi:hypothetical protein
MRGTHSQTTSFSRFFFGFLLLGVCKRHYHERVQNVNELHDKIIRAAEWVANEMLANTGDVCHDTNGAHIEIS